MSHEGGGTPPARVPRRVAPGSPAGGTPPASGVRHLSGGPGGVDVSSQLSIFLFWLPLAAQWIMMSLEGPFLAAIIARMGDPTYNLAAYGVAFAVAILVESPVIMLMSASTALVEDASSYRRLRNFANLLNVASTGLLVLVLFPPVYGFLMSALLGLPPEVTRLVYVSLWLLLPWPAAIGYRRFLHGVLIRNGHTRLVAYGTILRLAGMAAMATLLYVRGGLPGAWVGAASLSAGVCVEAVATRIMAAGVIRRLLSEEDSAPRHEVVGYREIGRFYYPLALTSLISLTVHPMLTFFMGRAPAPVESLAVFPVVHALAFLFRAPGFSYQEVVIALSGRELQNVRPLIRFGVGMALASSAALALVAFTPLAWFWFETVSGLPPELSSMALAPTRVLVLLPALAVVMAFQNGLLVQGRATRVVTAGTVVEVAAIAALFVLFGWTLGLLGVTAAMVALVGGRMAGAAYLVRPVRRVLSRPPGG
jgi:progressive ankylosis protein